MVFVFSGRLFFPRGVIKNSDYRKESKGKGGREKKKRKYREPD